MLEVSSRQVILTMKILRNEGENQGDSWQVVIWFGNSFCKVELCIIDYFMKISSPFLP